MKIIITGSLGHISRPVTIELLRLGHNVTVISNSPGREKEISALGADAAIGSLADTRFLINTFAGADLVYAMIPPDYTQVDQLGYYQLLGRSYASALEAAAIGRVVLLSSFGADLASGTGVIVGSHHMEEMFGQLPATIVTRIRPTSFYYNLLAFIPVIQKTGKIIANYGGNDKVLMVSPVDIAKVIVEEIIHPSGTVRYISSDERTCNEVAAILGAAIGKPDLTWITISDAEMRSALEAAGVPAPVAASVAETYGALHSGLLANDYRRNPPATMGSVKIEDYAKEFAAAYFKASIAG